MPDQRTEEHALLAALNACPELARQGTDAALADDFGVLLLRGGVAIGLWSYVDGRFRYRTLANWDAVHDVSTVAATVFLSRIL